MNRNRETLSRVLPKETVKPQNKIIVKEGKAEKKTHRHPIISTPYAPTKVGVLFGNKPLQKECLGSKTSDKRTHRMTSEPIHA